MSFIFALRINWDLLQLRMQEDAEAEARKKQRVENDDMDACVSAASDCSDEDEDVEGKDFDESGDDSEMEIEAEKSRHLSATSEKKANQGRDATPMVLWICWAFRLINIGIFLFQQEQDSRGPKSYCRTETPLDCDGFR